MRPELDKKVEAATEATAWWPPERQAAVARRLHNARRKAGQARRMSMPLVAAACLGGAAMTAVFWLIPREQAELARGTIPESEPGVVVFSDGARAWPRGAVRLQETRARQDCAIVTLDEGEALVRPRPGRGFCVEVGSHLVKILGHSFQMSRQGAGVRIAMLEGPGKVFFQNTVVDIPPGDARFFAPETPPTSPKAPARDSHARAESQPAARAKASEWRRLARARAFDSAYRALEAQGRSEIADEPADLLLAADVARLSHHPASAVWPLERIVTRHVNDRRAPAAAFTLGRVLLEDLDKPAAAADAFARARALAPQGALGEHALVREIEARIRASDRSAARALGEVYDRAYPAGSFRDTVDRLLGRAEGR